MPPATGGWLADAPPPNSCISKSPSLSSSLAAVWSRRGFHLLGRQTVGHEAADFLSFFVGVVDVEKGAKGRRGSRLACSSFFCRISRMRKSPLMRSFTVSVNR